MLVFRHEPGARAFLAVPGRLRPLSLLMLLTFL